jgi:hypothetical protein
MPYFIRHIKVRHFVGLLLLALIASVFLATSITKPANAASSCYRYIDSTKIEYVSPDCDKSGVTYSYTSTDGGITYNGPQIKTGGGQAAASVCHDGTNKIVLSGGTAKLIKQNVSSDSRPRCLDGTTTSTIDIKGWSGKNAVEQAGASAEATELYSQFGDTLDPLKNKWVAYNCPSGVGGVEVQSSCGEAGWKNLVYECWGKRTSTANVNTASASPEEYEKTMKTGFATCMSSKIGNGVTKDAVVTLLEAKGVSLTNIAAAVTAAGDKAEEAATPTPTTAEPTTSCGVEGIGWLVCPVMNFLGSVADNAFSFLSETFLETKSDVLSNSAIRAAWSTMRNIANVAFVIAFLIIIFSQLTGQGVTNYGVKKMLPRLVIAAILVNVSFFICQIAVDLSNILGYSLNSLLSNSYVQIAGDISGKGDASSNGLGIAVLVAGVVAGAIGVAMAVTMPVLLAVLLALILIVLILVARTALIVLLTIISPLAFVAFLLPNTEQWFKKWYKMYFALLMVFPIIAVVFGASTLAANVIKDASGDNVMMQIVAVGVAALPLFVVPSLLKGSLSAAGSIGAKISNLSSKATGRIGGKVKDTSKLGQLQQFRGQQAKIRRAQILGGTYKGSNRNPLNWGRNASSALNSRLNDRTGKFGTEQSRLGERINAKIEAEEVTAAKATIDKLGLSLDQMTQLAKGGSVLHNGKTIKSDTATQKAAISSIIQTGDHNSTRSLIDTVGNSSDTSIRAHLADSLASSSNRPGYVGGAALGAIREGKAVNTETLAQEAIKVGAYSAEKIATGDKDELSFIHDQLANVSASERAQTISNAQDALSDEVLNKKIGKNSPSIINISRHP